MNQKQALHNLLLNVQNQTTNLMDIRHEQLELIESVVVVVIKSDYAHNFRNIMDNFLTFLTNCREFNMLVSDSDNDYVIELKELIAPYAYKQQEW